MATREPGLPVSHDLRRMQKLGDGAHAAAHCAPISWKVLVNEEFAL